MHKLTGRKDDPAVFIEVHVLATDITFADTVAYLFQYYWSTADNFTVSSP